MKKKYVAPIAEKIEFCYSDQVVASGGGNDSCVSVWMNQGEGSCEHGNSFLRPLN